MEDKQREKTVTLYHGTTITHAKNMVGKKGIDPSKGHGEFGLGFYTVFSSMQALHIAQYYWDAEKRYTQKQGGVAVISIEIPLETWQKMMKNKIVCYDFDLRVPGVPFPKERTTWSRDAFADGDDRYEDRGMLVIIGPIKDASTPYLQAVFGTKAAGILNDGVRRIVQEIPVEGPIGKDKYVSEKARQEAGSFAAVASEDSQVEMFIKGAEAQEGSSARKIFVEKTFGGFDDKDLPAIGTKAALILVKFLKEKGVKMGGDDSPGGAIFAYVNKGFPLSK